MTHKQWQRRKRYLADRIEFYQRIGNLPMLTIYRGMMMQHMNKEKEKP